VTTKRKWKSPFESEEPIGSPHFRLQSQGGKVHANCLKLSLPHSPTNANDPPGRRAALRPFPQSERGPMTAEPHNRALSPGCWILLALGRERERERERASPWPWRRCGTRACASGECPAPPALCPCRQALVCAPDTAIRRPLHALLFSSLVPVSRARPLLSSQV
jgi:hypothetical protein